MDPKIYSIMNFSKRYGLTPQTAVLVMAAERRGIPWRHAVPPWKVVIGTGPLQIFFKDSRTTKISPRALTISWNKQKTIRRLRKAGIPASEHEVVYSLEEAQEKAAALGYPLVIKPLVGSQGHGVSVKITTREEVERAYKRALYYSQTVIVERYIEGNDYRLFVVGDRLVAAAHRLPARVIGDGIRTIKTLIQIANTDIRRSWGQRNILSRIVVNDDLRRMLDLAGYTMNTVPKEGEVVVLRSVANVSAGGYSVDVTDQVHPDNRALAVRAAHKVGLKVAGVDFICKDVSKSYKEVGGGIIEINGTPGLRIHLTPREGKVQDIGGAMIDLLFPKKSRKIDRKRQKEILSGLAPAPPSVEMKPVFDFSPSSA